jgi:hypothetical protein
MKYTSAANCSASSLLEQDSIHPQTSSLNAKRQTFEDKIAPSGFLFGWFSNPRAAEFAYITSRIVDRIIIAVGATMVIFLFTVQLVTALRAQYFTPFSLIEESAYTFISANNYLKFGFLNSGLLQDFSTSPEAADHPFAYNHMPPGPDITNAILLWITGGNYPLVRIIFSIFAIVGFAIYCSFGRLFLAQFRLRGSGFLLFGIGGWTLIQMLERQVYSPFALLVFFPMHLYMIFLQKNRMWVFFTALGIVFISTLYLDYSIVAAILVCWVMFFLTRLMPIRLIHLVLIQLAIGAGILAHLLQNMLYLGWPAFVTELRYVLSNRITGFPTQSELAAFYHSIGFVHHGSHPIDWHVLKEQIIANLHVLGGSSLLIALASCIMAMIGTVMLHRGSGISDSPAAQMRHDLWFFVRLFVWASVTVIAPIAGFPAFAQEVTLRGTGANYFFLAIAYAAVVGYVFEVICYFGFWIAEIFIAPRTAYGGAQRVTPEIRPALERLGGVVLIGLGLFAAAVALNSVFRDYRRDARYELRMIYRHAKDARTYEALNDVGKFRGQLFMTNINIPTVGFLADAPGFGVCNPQAIGTAGEIDIKYCKSALMRRYEYWAAHRPALFYYFDDPKFFPGFADCVPAGTLVGTERKGPACMTELLDRLSRQYRLVLQNPFVRVFDLTNPRRHAHDGDAVEL